MQINSTTVRTWRESRRKRRWEISKIRRLIAKYTRYRRTFGIPKFRFPFRSTPNHDRVELVVEHYVFVSVKDVPSAAT